MERFSSKGVVILAAVALVVAAAIFWLRARPAATVAPASGPASGIVVVDRKGDDRASPSPAETRSAPTRELPAAMRQALGLPDNARLKEPIPDSLTGSIVCGNVSVAGADGPYRRFVYNRAGDTGAVDDGTELFRKFASKICLQER